MGLFGLSIVKTKELESLRKRVVLWNTGFNSSQNLNSIIEKQRDWLQKTLESLGYKVDYEKRTIEKPKPINHGFIGFISTTFPSETKADSVWGCSCSEKPKKGSTFNQPRDAKGRFVKKK